LKRVGSLAILELLVFEILALGLLLNKSEFHLPIPIEHGDFVYNYFQSTGKKHRTIFHLVSFGFATHTHKVFNPDLSHNALRGLFDRYQFDLSNDVSSNDISLNTSSPNDQFAK